MIAAALAACGPAKPTDTVDELVVNPERLKEIQRLCKEDRAKVNDGIYMRAAQAFRRRFMGARPEQKIQ
ncbi:hypothetical protein V8Z74_15195 [Comamonas sp. w2-DMI]|uniref:hypothetical protein n=1 Tax=Comamonas sp. w2-DMI TaxID=3126391 RepID=UPI0032E4F78A